MLRYNTTANAFEGYANGAWSQVTMQPVGSTANVNASGPPVSAGIYPYTATANYTPAFGAIANINNGVWPANGNSDVSNANCVNLYDPSTAPQQYIVVDLGSIKTIGNVYTSIDGLGGVFVLGVAFSTDGTTFTSSTLMYSSSNQQGQSWFVSSALAPSVSARYVRLSNGSGAGSVYYNKETLCQFAVGP